MNPEGEATTTQPRSCNTCLNSPPADSAWNQPERSVWGAGCGIQVQSFKSSHFAHNTHWIQCPTSPKDVRQKRASFDPLEYSFGRRKPVDALAEMSSRVLVVKHDKTSLGGHFSYNTLDTTVVLMVWVPLVAGFQNVLLRPHSRPTNLTEPQHPKR